MMWQQKSFNSLKVPAVYAVEMLAQHIITKPVFDALFDSEDFSKNNPVSQALDKVVALLEDATEYTTYPDG